ncbi:glycosyltransferase family 4 protein [Bacillus sp. 37MA]|uniref:glycosyltransferase family 4 protein n=1 Tax=Bacillus sp. 37MA TaxID=1132442 RepID=UPI00036AF39D|nr:glycosyltransferase family 4 protein [Bacillus sp. 37MA]
MKILLITILYPSYEEHSRKEISYALHYFAKDWVSSGHDVRVMKIYPKYPAIFNLTKKGKKNSRYRKDATFKLEDVEVNRLTINKFPKINYFQKDIRRMCSKILHDINMNNQPDIIVCHMIDPSIYIAKMLKEELNVPLILTIHQSDIFLLTNTKKRLESYKEVEPFINRIGFRNRNLMDKYDALNLTSKNNFIIHSGINKDLIISDYKLQKKINSQSQFIFIAANMIALKNIDIVIKAFEKIAVDEDVYLKIAGEGPEKNKLIKLAEESSVNDRIEFLGYITRESVIENMEKSDVFVMVSSPETFGLVYIEAMSKACITIGTKGEGIDGVIKDSENGYLCEPRNVDALANKLTKALKLNSDQKEKIITNAVQTAKNMTQEEISNKYLDVLQDTIKNFNKS